MLSFATFWAKADQELLCQHRNPVLFFQTLEQEGVWRVLWPVRLLLILVGLIIAPGILVASSGEPLVVLAVTVATVALVLVSGLFMIIASPIAGERPGLWLAYLFLYHFSFPTLFVILLCALAALTPVGLWLGWLIGLPWLLGLSVADASALAVYQSARKQRNQRKKRRPGGPAADLPELSLGRLAYWARTLITSLLVIAALLMPWLYGWNGVAGSVALLAGAAGCARIESTLLAAFGWPLVRFDPSQQGWCATYPARTALYVNPLSMRRGILSSASSSTPSAALRTLLGTGCLRLVLRRAFARLPAAELYPLLLDLSLHEGGAEIIRFLRPALSSPMVQSRAEQYAALAAEAAKPPDLQRWIALLPEQPEGAEMPLVEEVDRILVYARATLLQYQEQPIVTTDEEAFQRFMQSLGNQTEPGEAGLPCWPVALQKQVELHWQFLHTSN